MHLIIGGAYQGKLDYARETYGLTEGDIFQCGEGEIDRSRRCLHHMERYALYCLRRGEEPCLEGLEECVILFDDIFCGVVPLDAEVRAWREAAGRLAGALSRQAETVTRIFCGLPMRLK